MVLQRNVFLQVHECAADSQSTMDKSQSIGSGEKSREIDSMDENNETQVSFLLFFVLTL